MVWRHVIGALQTVVPEIGSGAMTRLEALAPTPFEAVLTELLNDLAQVSHDIVLVLDDYHLVDNPAVHDSLAFLLDHLPACFHIIIATRAVPPLPLARLRACGQLGELGAADLRLTSDEAAELLRDVLRLPLHAADITALAARGEGWVAGLHLAALALRDRSDPAEFVRTFSGSDRALADYLLDDVLARQPADIQNFLFQTVLLSTRSPA